MNLPQPIPYQGSKRALAKYILPFIPNPTNHLYEPFAGSAAITIAAAYRNLAKRYFINDLNGPLMDLLALIINDPEIISVGYEELWNRQIGQEKEFYNIIRDEFNRSHQPQHFLYLLARVVKGAIRYNSNGEFNQSPDNRRKGKNPRTMRQEIINISKLLRNKTVITALDYREATRSATCDDIIYLDPPYQGVCSNRDSRYFAGISFDDLVVYLENLNARRISFILSYDGKTGDKIYGKDIPLEIGAQKIEIEAGRSTSSTLNGGSDITIESIYLSKTLMKRLNISPSKIQSRIGKKSISPPLLI